MGNTHTFQQVRRAVFRLSIWQLGLTMLLVSLAAFAFNVDAAISVLVGGIIGILAGFYQAQRMLRIDASLHQQKFMQGVWISEALKIVLTAALFVVAIRLLEVEMVPTIVGYSGTYIIYWAALGTNYPWVDTPIAINNLRDRNWPDA
ncbi:MAG: ATP synthase subunit I [Pseudomonadota bacterium]|nr:ATP synthase subunit I [Pseudomonadota bacterium]